MSTQPAQTTASQAPGTAGRPDFRALVAEASRSLAGAPPEEILRWALTAFPRRDVGLCTSLQAGGIVLLDMAWRVDPEIQVFTIDSGRLPAETLQLIDDVRDRYQMRVEVLYPDAEELSDLVSEHGMNLFYRAPELRLACCEVRKVRPLQRRLATLQAWITGIRREENATREAVEELEVDVSHGGIVKISPLARWTETEVWEYVERHHLPRNALYQQGYTSIGCAPCTRPTEPGEHPRAGRWWWEQGAKECGIQYEIQVTEEGETVAVMKRSQNGTENSPQEGEIE